MRLTRSAAIAAAMTLTIAGTAAAGWCKPPKPPEPEATITICQDPRAVVEAVGLVTLRWVPAGGPRKGEVQRKEIDAGNGKTIKRWVLGRTRVWVEADGQRITPKVPVNRRTNVGRCPLTVAG